jgi:glycosyltransferase involved in cell wall biosynthesis
MSNKPLVSIGLPTYNRAATLGRAINSALNQDYQNIELLISDNASTDETEAICLDAARRNKRVKYLRQQTNQGATANFREVLRQSGGEFFMWLADDDWLDQSYVGRCVQVLVERPDYSLVCGKARYFHERRFVREGAAIDLLQDKGSERVLAHYGQVEDNGTFYGLMRRTQILRAPLRNTLGGDWLLVAAIAFMGKVKTLPDVYANRSLGGATASYEKIAATLGLSSFAANHPNLSIAASAFSDIVWRSTVYSKGGILRRLSLGCKVFALVARRGGLSFIQVCREIAFIVMTKLLPAAMVDKIHNRRRHRRAEVRE